MAHQTLQARYTKAKTTATTRLQSAENVEVDQIFTDFKQASQMSINCNKLTMALMDSYNNLQRLHHEWETFIEEKAQAETQEARTEAENEQA
uniref:Biogenesis of lysosome-related organelles complex 1 subunit 1 n=1 Tax=Panagrolaimus sp. ES5 TaxID=591445 RepID=A0AC34GKA8_9BILA